MKLKIIIVAYLFIFVLWLLGMIPRTLDFIFYPAIAVVVIIFLILAFAGGSGNDLKRIEDKLDDIKRQNV